MGTFTNTSQFTPVSTPPAISRGGGKRELVLKAKVTGSASYATGGDTLSVPAPSGYTLYEVRVTSQPSTFIREWRWDQNVSTPKLIAYDAVNTQEGNATDVSADVLFIEAVFVQP
jgi:hypothetical protein